VRAPTELPRRRRPRGSRNRVWLIVLAAALFVLLTSLRGIAGFYTDYLWFDSLNFSGVFTGVLRSKVLLGLLFTAVLFIVLWANLLIADRLAPRFRPTGPEEELVERYHELIGERTGLVRLLISVLFALILGTGVSGQWDKWILFINARDVGQVDPQFKTDVGFYLFRLPFLSFLVDWAFAAVVVVLLVTAVAHYLNGGIRVQGPGQRVTPQVKAHLSVLLGVLALIKAAGYWLQRYELNFSTRGAVDGATYTDVNAQLPVLYLLILISLAAFVLFIVNIWRRGWALPVIAVGLWALVAVLLGGVYPAIVQRFSVEPSESSKEREYIARNIEATRAAVGLDAVENQTFQADASLDEAGLDANAEIVRNIRLWEPAQLARNYQRTQEIRRFYQVNDVDVDRYEVDGEMTEVELATRELDTAGVPRSSWESTHSIYTHGYGAVVSPTNGQTEDGRPQYYVRNVPVEAEEGFPDALEQPNIYVGEDLGGYVVVDTDRQEIDYQDAEGKTQFTEYDGADGVDIGSLWNKAAFALRFGDINPLISGNLRSSSKILYQRDVRERVETLAPFLRFDADPYPVLIDGGIKFVMDAYTTSNSYPYAQRVDTTSLANGSGLNGDYNYVRNSVKAVVDAYEGSVTFYVVDPDDPLAAAYADAFPELFEPDDEIPDELRAHFRYPEDLFRIQTNMWGRYHLSDPDDFYTEAGAWDVAQDPGDESATTTVESRPDGTTTTTRRAPRIAPTYQILRLPTEEGGSGDPEFVITRPFVPSSENDTRQELTAFMAARSDPEGYGQLVTYTVPGRRDGPAQVANTIRSNTRVASAETLLCQEGSSCTFGDLLTVPIEQSLLYVWPLYVESTAGQIPELRRVVVFWDGDVFIEPTLFDALSQAFGGSPRTLEVVEGRQDEPSAETPGEEPGTPGEEAPSGDVAGLLQQASDAFARADEALRAGEFARYEEEIARARDLVADANALAAGEAGGGGDGGGDASTTTTSTTASA
jgi:uncharacterized membrane protein (UPF0182 family)